MKWFESVATRSCASPWRARFVVERSVAAGIVLFRLEAARSPDRQGGDRRLPLIRAETG